MGYRSLPIRPRPLRRLQSRWRLWWYCLPYKMEGWFQKMTIYVFQGGRNTLRLIQYIDTCTTDGGHVGTEPRWLILLDLVLSWNHHRQREKVGGIQRILGNRGLVLASRNEHQSIKATLVFQPIKSLISEREMKSSDSQKRRKLMVGLIFIEGGVENATFDSCLPIQIHMHAQFLWYNLQSNDLALYHYSYLYQG